MKKLIISFSLIVLALSGYSQQAFDYRLGAINFKPGEKLIYNIHYGFINGGQGEITIQKKYYKGEPVFFASLLARSTGLADKLYKVEDRYESYFEPVTGYTLKAIESLKEGDYRFYNEAHYNRADSTVYSMKSDSIYNAPGDILDMIGLLYYIRRMDLENLESGQYIDINTFFDDEVFPFDFRYKGIEKVETKLGSFRCYRFDPVVGTGRDFKNDDDMKVYLSADKNKIPIRVKFNLLIGSLKCDLVEYHNLKFALQETE
ncbi:MAG: DUF3108 domain-containing protein [Bacteroidetes bacterium]|jgi:hypothetical protein|nr:DUF3108 domain-containing protein [Bacteroidota bacterium]